MIRSKHIHLFVTNDLTYDQRMQRICIALSEADYRVTLVGRRKKESIPWSNEQVSPRRFKCLFNKGSLFYAEMNIRILFHILFQKIDVVCAADLDTLLGVTLAAKIKNIPIVFDAHEWFTEVPELENRNRVKKIWSAIEKYCVPKTALRYTVNVTLAEIFTKNLNRDFHVIRNVPIFPPSIDVKQEAKKTIIYQGALNKGRGLEDSILAMHHLHDCELWLVGEGDLSEELRQLVLNEELSERVSFMGFKSPEDLKLITAKAHVGLNLLEGESKNYYYSLANKFFDYMHAGIPSVNMQFPEYEMILKEYACGITIANCEPSLVAQKINYILSDPRKYNEMRNEAKRAQPHFTWEKEKEKLIELWLGLST